MKVVIDTNCFLQIVPKTSKYRPIFNAYLNGNLELVISNEIFFEYKEVFAAKMNEQVSINLMELILKKNNTIQIDIYYKWNLISIDTDDNKFVDAAIASACDFLITQDGHFNILSEIKFPVVKIIKS